MLYDLKKRIFLLKSFYQTQYQSNSKSIPSRVQVFYIPRSVSNKKHRLHVRERRLSRLHNQKQEAAKRKTGGGQKPAENSDNGSHFVDEKISFCNRCISNADLNYSPRRFAPKAVQVS